MSVDVCDTVKIPLRRKCLIDNGIKDPANLKVIRGNEGNSPAYNKLLSFFEYLRWYSWSLISVCVLMTCLSCMAFVV